jgi:hypothetical protein
LLDKKRTGQCDMKSYIGVTDNDWFAILSHKPEIGEINFYVMWRLGYLTEITALLQPVIREWSYKKANLGQEEYLRSIDI